MGEVWIQDPPVLKHAIIMEKVTVLWEGKACHTNDAFSVQVVTYNSKLQLVANLDVEYFDALEQ